MELRPKHLRAIDLLARTDLGTTQVAAMAGVNRSTLGRWLKDKAFAEELAFRRDLLPYHLDGLRVSAAREVLRSILGQLDFKWDRMPVTELMEVLKGLVGKEFDRARPIEPAPLGELAAAEAPAPKAARLEAPSPEPGAAENAPQKSPEPALVR